MDDAELRRLERLERMGDPAAAKALAAARIRADSGEKLWELFDSLFDLLEQRPWDETLVSEMKRLCTRLPATSPQELATATQNVVIREGEYSGTPNGLKRVVILGGRFRPSSDSPIFHESERVLIADGTFGETALDLAKHVIILGGIFNDLENIDYLTITGGFFQTLTPGEGALIMGGQASGLCPAPDTIAVGGTFGGILWPTSCTARVWLPKHILGHMDVPFHAQVVAAAAQIGRYSRISNEQAIQESRGAIFLRECPVLTVPLGYAQMDIFNLIYAAPQQALYDLLPHLRADEKITRKNIGPWMDAQYQRLKQISTRCATKKQG